MEDLVLGRKATAEEQEVIDKCQDMLREVDLGIVAVGAPKPPRPQ